MSSSTREELRERRRVKREAQLARAAAAEEAAQVRVFAAARSVEPADHGRAEAAIVELYAKARGSGGIGRLKLKPPRFEWHGSPSAIAERAGELLGADPKPVRVAQRLSECLRTRLCHTSQGLSGWIRPEPWLWPVGNMILLQRELLRYSMRMFAGGLEAWWIEWNAGKVELGSSAAAGDVHKLMAWREYAATAGWMIPFEDVCLVAEKPVEVHVDERGYLHREAGQAVSYQDGTGVCAVHGCAMESWMVDEDVGFTVDDIRDCKNAEQRRALIEMYGVENYMRDSDSTLLHEDDWGKLWRSDTEIEVRRIAAPFWEHPSREHMVMVEVLNSSPEPDGSFKTYFLRVDPLLRPMRPDGTFGHPQKRTALNAIASTFGLTGDEYLQMLVQT